MYHTFLFLALYLNTPDLKQFLEANHLHRHMDRHGHAIYYDQEDEPHLLYENELTPWAVIRETVPTTQSGKMVSHAYTHEGIVPGHDAAAIHRFEMQPPKPSPLVQIVSRSCFPPHCWLRLINRRGEVYSLGFFGQELSRTNKELVWQLIPQKGCILSPDPLEVIDAEETLVVTEIPLSDEEWALLFQLAQALQLQEELSFQLLNIGKSLNCAGFIKSLLHSIAFEIPTRSWLRPFDNPYDLLYWQINQKRVHSPSKGENNE